MRSSQVRRDRPRVSVVVPTHNRPELLHRCLDALVKQDFDGGMFEVVVVDDAATASARRCVDAWTRRTAGSGPEICYVPLDRAGGPARARNVGVREARGTLIAFTDDDCLPRPTWLQAGVAALSAGAAGASGTIVVPTPPVPTDYERNVARLQHSAFVTANCFYRREALEAVGGFDERFTMAWREDSDLYFALKERGARLVAARNAEVLHEVRAAPWGVSLWQQRKSMYNALLYKKHPRLYREHVQSAPPWHYYCTVASLLAALLGVAAGAKGVLRAGTATWCALTLAFCVRRLRGTSRRPGHVIEMIVTSALIPPLAVYWRLRGALTFRVLFL